MQAARASFSSLALPVLLLAASISACKKTEAQARAKESEAAPVKVKTVAVAEREMPRFLTVTGTLKADRETEVAADATGKVIQIFVERGQPVKVGDPLVRLDIRTASLSEAQARAQARLARQSAELATIECDRGEALFKGGSIPKADYDRRKSQCETSQSSVEIARSGEQLASKLVKDAIIRAPFAGLVGERFVQVGQYVRPDSKVASIYAVKPLRLELTIPEANVAAAKKGAAVEFRVAALGDTFNGTVRYVSPFIRARSRDLVVEAVVKNEQGELKPGMFAEARLNVGEQKVPVAPQTAVRKGEVASSVFFVQQGRATERIVQLGETRDGLIALLAGVKPGDKLIDAPAEQVQDGAQVAE